jgi:hypothetical protein
MAKDLIGYDVLVENGLRSVIREALRRVAADGWPGTHHAYITFRTDAPGVDVPDALRARYPDELTIVLQHQFWGLEVEDDFFAVTLSFSKVGHRLVVPFSALTGYADPSVKFGLQFGAAARGEENAASPRAGDATARARGDETAPAPEADDDDTAPEAGGEKVVALEQFRKK